LGDIPALARHFAERAANRFGLAFVEPSPRDVQLLMSYPWPGNIRELGAVIDRAAILGDGRGLEIATALGSAATPTSTRSRPTGRSGEALAAAPPPTSQVATLDEAMRQHIVRALMAARGRIEGPHGAAKLLGINPHTLRARMRKLGVEWARFRAPHAPELP
jgi:DNA-binding NtrC family response regulator